MAIETDDTAFRLEGNNVDKVIAMNSIRKPPHLPISPSPPLTGPQEPSGNWWMKDPTGKPIDRMPPLRNYPDVWGDKLSELETRGEPSPMEQVIAMNTPLAKTWKDTVPKFELPPQPKPLDLPTKKISQVMKPLQEYEFEGDMSPKPDVNRLKEAGKEFENEMNLSPHAIDTELKRGRRLEGDPVTERLTMSDETPDPVVAGQKSAQAYPKFVLEIRPNGQHAVIDRTTGQVRHVGSIDSARQFQAQLNAKAQRFMPERGGGMWPQIPRGGDLSIPDTMRNVMERETAIAEDSSWIMNNPLSQFFKEFNDKGWNEFLSSARESENVDDRRAGLTNGEWLTKQFEHWWKNRFVKSRISDPAAEDRVSKENTLATELGIKDIKPREIKAPERRHRQPREEND